MCRSKNFPFSPWIFSWIGAGYLIVLVPYGWFPIVSVLGLQLISILFFQLFMAPVARAVYTVSQREGSFRYFYGRLRGFYECICFHGGEKKEHANSQLLFAQVFRATFTQYKAQVILLSWTIFFQYLQTFLAPYIIVFVAYMWFDLELPAGEDGRAALYTVVQFVTIFQTFLSVLGGFMNQLASVAGLVNRIGHSLDVFQDLANEQRFEYTQAHTTEITYYGGTAGAAVAVNALEVVTPARQGGRILVQDLTFTAEAKASLCIVGPSGCGKSSVLRVLASLWPFSQGTLSKPAGVGNQGVFFVPQRPYLTEGSLRSQLLYPLTPETIADASQDEKLLALLRIVDLDYLFEWGLDSRAPWADILSTGEQQRLGFVRLLFHSPAVAIMDEATSALDLTIQTRCMEACKSAGMVLISVAHRPSVLGFHEKILRLSPGSIADGPASWQLEDSR
jgi:ABC-type uncharacterized transport system fused permease/ATPase subunit